MSSFTPISSLLGGGLIGLAAGLLILLNGRIAGVSGILGGLLERGPEWRERVAFIAGLILAPLLFALLVHTPAVTIEASTIALIAGGLLVGYGTRLGGGCTSGHGICGVARLSPRSLIATLVFIAAGMAVVYVMRHLLTGG